MSKSHGMMIGFDEAIEWAERQPDSTVKNCALNRLRYERDKAIPVRPKYHKGKYVTSDYYTCGSCGSTVTLIDKWCHNCGFKVDWRNT